MEIYLVGGAVRDRLLGLPVKDRDWVVVGSTPEQMLALGYKPVGRDFPVFLHPKTREEYALARTERKQGRGYRGFVVDAHPEVTLEQDLLRRDLTINAMAEDEQGCIIDPYGGLEDLKLRCLKAVSPAFAEDPLRVLRCARFAARLADFNFYVEPATLQLMQNLVEADELAHLTPERVWQEINKALTSARPWIFFEVLQQAEALQALWPELAAHYSQLTQADKQLTEQAAACNLGVAGALVLLTRGMQLADLQQLMARLALPRRVQQQLISAHQAYQHPGLQLQEPEKVLSLFEALDAWRQTDVAAVSLQLMALLNPQFDLQQALDLMHLLRQEKAADLVAAGYRGQALGEALREKRLQRLAEEMT